MAGIQADTPVPTSITLHQTSCLLEIAFEDGVSAQLSGEFLRVYSPSAEVRGHGQGQEVLQIGKRDVIVTGVEPVGNYAIRLLFSDNHDSGIYSWDYLYELAIDHELMWENYLDRLSAACASRDPAAPIPTALQPKAKPKACGSH